MRRPKEKAEDLWMRLPLLQVVVDWCLPPPSPDLRLNGEAEGAGEELEGFVPARKQWVQVAPWIGL